MDLAAGRVDLPGAQGQPVAAWWEPPRGGPASRVAAVLAHEFPDGDDPAAVQLCRTLGRHGIGVLRLRVAGAADPGDRTPAAPAPDASDAVAEVVAAAGLLARHGAVPALLIGHGQGAAAILAAAHRIPQAAALVTVGAPAADGTPAPGLPLLVMHSPGDNVVGIENARRVFEAARHPRSFVALDGADHDLSDPADAIFAAGMIAAWAGRYLSGARDDAEGSATADVDAGAVVVAEAGTGRLAQVVRAGRHRLTVDEPRSAGGDDTGPNPYDLLLAALGACTSMTLRMYAERKGLPVDRVEVALRHDRIHAEDCATCETGTGMLDRIRRVVTIDGDLDQAQRERLLEIADRCPVHRTLTSEVTVETSAG
jgi:uncharacterized OsmC-like protein/pimeloyl-ACP methyl ester carboxylesterase